MSLITLIIGIAIGAVVALTIEHGWGWVLAQFHAKTGK